MKDRILAVMVFISAAAILLFGLSSCGDKEILYGDMQTPVASFTPGLFYEGGLLDSPEYFEQGCTMEFLKNGRITNLCVFVPDNGLYRVTLWDASTQTTLVSVNIEAEEARPACVEIVTQLVKAGDRYMVTVHSNDRYIYRTTDARPIFPAIVGDVNLIDFGFSIDPDGFEFPDIYDFFSVWGIADIIFEPEL
ncbi:MAG: hypothetical protein GY751_06085 [Bacteroidetes bacterium]|nr:hypothetical protein [Bacteroidota bacterium]